MSKHTCCVGEDRGEQDENGEVVLSCDEWCDCPACMSRFPETTRI